MALGPLTNIALVRVPDHLAWSLILNIIPYILNYISVGVGYPTRSCIFKEHWADCSSWWCFFGKWECESCIRSQCKLLEIYVFRLWFPTHKLKMYIAQWSVLHASLPNPQMRCLLYSSIFLLPYLVRAGDRECGCLCPQNFRNPFLITWSLLELIVKLPIVLKV